MSQFELHVSWVRISEPARFELHNSSQFDSLFFELNSSYPELKLTRLVSSLVVLYHLLILFVSGWLSNRLPCPGTQKRKHMRVGVGNRLDLQCTNNTNPYDTPLTTIYWDANASSRRRRSGVSYTISTIPSHLNISLIVPGQTAVVRSHQKSPLLPFIYQLQVPNNSPQCPTSQLTQNQPPK